MLLRPSFIIAAVILFSALNGWALVNGLQHNNGWSTTMALLAIGGTFYFVHLYYQLLNTSAENTENELPSTDKDE